MTQATDKVHVIDQSFGILDRGEIPIETWTWLNGLARVMSIGAVVHTGISTGYVRVTAIADTAPPVEVDPGPWDEIVEISVFSAYGELRVESYTYGPVTTLPLLSSQGPGSYRFRVHARGRDLHYDAVQNDSGEDYLVVGWPAEIAPEVIIRASDRCKEGVRRSAEPTSAHGTHVPGIPPELRDEMEYRALTHQALLDAIAKHPPETS
ncbi:MAG TPA: hypothetical protein VGP24_03845 [Glaciihabitans sp.]|nr:hypothetical protein [Glaciihabitans sp.]